MIATNTAKILSRMIHCVHTFLMLFAIANVFLGGDVSASQMSWASRAPVPASGRHHPITFANETHAFYLTGTTSQTMFTKDFYMYEEATSTWTDLTLSGSAFPGQARSFAYGVVLNQAMHPKAYLGFGVAPDGEHLVDFWEFDMTTHTWTRLADFIGPGRRHPAMVPVRRSSQQWEIHVGLGDGVTGNLNDWYSYDISTNVWIQMPDFPSSKRHHPFHFGIGNLSYAGLGHSDGFDPYIERDWYHFDGTAWTREPDFESFDLSDDLVQKIGPVSTEARVAGTEFSIELPLSDGDDGNGLSGAIGFVLSGDGDDHGAMDTGEFHAFYPAIDGGSSLWRSLPPHPGRSRWAPGSFVMRGSARAYFTSGYDRISQELYNDVWMIDLSPLFSTSKDSSTGGGEVAPTTSPPTVAPQTPTSGTGMASLNVWMSACWITYVASNLFEFL